MSQLLQQLRDIHLPGAPGWWPPAPGWWVVLVALVLLTALIVYLLWKHHRQTVDWDWQEWEQTEDPQQRGEIAHRWLRQAAAMRFDRSVTARLYGGGWVDFLRQQEIAVDAAVADWLAGVYQHREQPPEHALEWLQRTLPEVADRNFRLRHR